MLFSRGLPALSLAASAAAQLIDLSAINAAPDPTYTITPGLRSQVITYSEKAVLASVTHAVDATPLPQTEDLAVKKARNAVPHQRRAACDPQPTTPNIFNGNVDTPEEFVNDEIWAAVANAAVTPDGYSLAYQNLQAASNANGYMGYQMMNAYDVDACAAHCNATNGCMSFNIFIERDPIVEPGYDSCQNPPAFPNIKCSFWGGPVTPDNALNDGQWRADFRVKIAASNGYLLMGTPSVHGYLPGTPLEAAAINAPLDCNGQGSYMGYYLFNDNNPYDVDRCAAACAAQNEYNIAHPLENGQPQLCKFWNTYILARDGVSQGQYCALYTQYWDPATYATNVGQYDGQGHHFTIQQSYTFANMSDPGVPICPADITEMQETAGPYCASYISSNLPSTTTTTTATVTPPCGLPPIDLPSRLKRRQEADAASYGIFETVNVTYPAKSDGPPAGAGTTVTGTGYVPSPTAPSTTTARANARRALRAKRDETATPSIFSSHNAYEVSSACSQIVAGARTLTITEVSTVTEEPVCIPTNNPPPDNPAPPAPTTTTPTSNPTIVQIAVPTRPAICGDGSAAYIIAGGFESSPGNYDDSYFGVSLPFPIGVYGYYTQYVYVSINGLISFNQGSTAYYNTRLPWGVSNNAAAFAFWDDLYIYAGQPQYVAYTICGEVGSRQITFEWKTGHFTATGGPTYHFTATFYEDEPGFVEYQYLDTPDLGGSATVGAQQADGRQYFQYSFNDNVEGNGLIVAFDTDGPEFQCGNQGLQYAWWAVNPNQIGTSYEPESSFNPTLYQTITPNGQGMTNSLTPFTQSNRYDVMNVYGQQLPGTQIVVETRGYIRAPQTGVYTFDISRVDNMAYIWVGPNAYNNWNANNALVYAEIHHRRSASGTYFMTAGSWYPIRVIYGNGRVTGYFTMTITKPDGTILLGTSSDPPTGDGSGDGDEIIIGGGGDGNDPSPINGGGDNTGAPPSEGSGGSPTDGSDGAPTDGTGNQPTDGTGDQPTDGSGSEPTDSSGTQPTDGTGDLPSNDNGGNAPDNGSGDTTPTEGTGSSDPSDGTTNGSSGGGGGGAVAVTTDGNGHFFESDTLSKRQANRATNFFSFSCDTTTAPPFAAFGAEAPPQVNQWCTNEFFCLPWWPGFGDDGFGWLFPVLL